MKSPKLTQESAYRLLRGAQKALDDFFIEPGRILNTDDLETAVTAIYLGLTTAASCLTSSSESEIDNLFSEARKEYPIFGIFGELYPDESKPAEHDPFSVEDDEE